ncbi:hypothetical protein AOLI_G00214920 [Acnodon oligacanthus]
MGSPAATECMSSGLITMHFKIAPTLSIPEGIINTTTRLDSERLRNVPPGEFYLRPYFPSTLTSDPPRFLGPLGGMMSPLVSAALRRVCENAG